MALDLEGVATTAFFAVFDGHGGKEVARFAALYMVRSQGIHELTSWFEPYFCALTVPRGRRIRKQIRFTIVLYMQ